ATEIYALSLHDALPISRCGLAATDHGKPDETFLFALRPVEEPVAARLALRGVRPRVAIRRFRRSRAEAQAREVKVAPVAADRDRVAAERFDAIHTVHERNLVHRHVRGIAHRVHLGFGRLTRSAPARAGAIDEVLPDV